MMVRRKKNLKKQKILLIGVVAATAFFTLIAGGAIYFTFLIKDLPSPYQFESRKVNESSKLYDRTGEVLLYEIHGEEKRTVVPFEEIPAILKKATLAAEDAGFYNQPAFNWRAIVRAVIVNLKEGGLSQGGSTITQQLARSLFLSLEKTITRKLKELVLAIELEARYTKDEIFSLYLNQIPYGSNAYGVEAASQIYFGKSVREVTLSEAAILASLPRAPSFYSPWGSHQKELFLRRDYVLERMVMLGFINEAEKEAALKKEIVFAPPSLGTIKAPHFALAVKEYLVERYGEEVVTSGGLRVKTTLDWEMQQAAEKAVSEGAKRNEELYGGKNAALIAQDPKTGQILALVGSKDYFDIENEGNFNVVTQGLRQPGSALKPFAYLTAFEKGYSPKTIIIDAPTEFAAQNPDCPASPDFANENKECFHPQNFDNQFRGPVAFEQGLAQSINIPSVKVLYLAGFDDVLKTLHKFGITTLKERSRYGLSLILGGGEVKLFDLANAYATLAEEGVRHKQKIVLEVKLSDDEILETYTDEAERVSDPNPVRFVNQILSDGELRKGLFQSSLALTLFPEKELALKTGTTNDYRDAWAMGYTPSLVVGVWAGNNNNAPMAARGSSILAAIPIWNKFLNEVLPKLPNETFTRPEAAPPTTKPMLNGEFYYRPIINNQVFPQLHSILYYVDRKDPLGRVPTNPEDDPQFYNWEEAVLNWARINVPNFYTYNQSLISGGSSFDNYFPPTSDIRIENVSPKNGSFVNLPLKVSADLKAVNGLKRVEVYFNRVLINTSFVGGNYYRYEYYLNFPLGPQNIIEIKAIDVLSKENKVSLIIFH